jgi:hypothetical protein
MKNLLVVAALALGGLTATFAQDTEDVQVEGTEQTEQMDVQVDAEAQAEAQDNFTAVEVSELPAAITEALAKDHPNATISQAFVNEESQYKLEVAQEDGSAVTLYADAEGNWIEM